MYLLARHNHNRGPSPTPVLWLGWLVVLAGLGLVGGCEPNTAEPPPLPQVYYYDLNTGELFAASAAEIPPIHAPSGPLQGARAGTPAGVRAYVFACGPENAQVDPQIEDPCRDPDRRFIAWLEKYSEDTRTVLQRVNPAGLDDTPPPSENDSPDTGRATTPRGSPPRPQRDEEDRLIGNWFYRESEPVNPHMEIQLEGPAPNSPGESGIPAEEVDPTQPDPDAEPTREILPGDLRRLERQRLDQALQERGLEVEQEPDGLLVRRPKDEEWQGRFLEIVTMYRHEARERCPKGQTLHACMPPASPR